MAKRSEAQPSRANKYGFSEQRKSETRTDPYIEQIIVPIKAIASGAAQPTGIFLPARCQVHAATINVFTAESSGTVIVASVGVAGGANNAIIDAAPVGGDGFKGTATVFNGGGQEITYTLGSPDFGELDAEVIIEYIGSDEA